MYILFLEDNLDSRRSLVQKINEQYSGVEMDIADNILDFHELLNTNRYDKIVMDLGIKRPPDIQYEYYMAFLKEVSLVPKTYNGSISLIGWDYYEQVMPKFMKEQYGADWKRRILLKSGHIDFIRTSKDLSNVSTLSKSDPDYFDELKIFFDR